VYRGPTSLEKGGQKSALTMVASSGDSRSVAAHVAFGKSKLCNPEITQTHT
jgi:hypothetical protein